MSELHYPLRWPITQPRTERRQKSNFWTPLHKVRFGLDDELCMLGARNAVVTTNLPLNRYGQPKATDQRKVTDPGVAVYFERKGQDQCLAVDRWLAVEDNLHAVELIVGAIRGLERWGSAGIVDAAFLGFAALPEGTSAEGFWAVLGVAPGAPKSEVSARYKELVKQHHPDTGGNATQFRAVIVAHEEYLAWRER